MARILTVVGARPQFIKAAAVSRQLAAVPGMSECMVHTGQHHDANMSAVFFAELGIRNPDYQLEIAGLGHGAMTGRMLEALEGVMLSERPAAVLVYGDTNSTLAGALAATKLHIPVAHVEAGLRSFNRAMPEEINRILTDHCSTILFTPTATATQNLRAEGVPTSRLDEVGDVMFDAALYFGDRADDRTTRRDHNVEDKPYVLATVHRQENTDDRDRLQAILGGLQCVSRELPVILPLHPRTRKQIAAFGLNDLLQGIRLTEPLGYLEMVALEKSAAVIATDSGGVQKEAFFYRVPCLTLRDETEWTELVEAGWNRLMPPEDPARIARAIVDAIGCIGADVAPYGDGQTAERIVERLSADFS
jgi:UDP-GlcNAc3NAcA epimerase